MCDEKHKSKSTQIVQSRTWSLLPRKTTGCEEDILLTLVRKAQEQIMGLSGEEMNCNRNLWGDVEFSISLKDLSDPNNYYGYRAAFRSLLKKTFDFGSDKAFELVPFLLYAKAFPQSNIVIVRVSKKVWDLILDFSKNFCMYNPETVLKLPTSPTKRIYQLICSNSKTLSYSLATLNEIFKTHYGPTMFEKRILAPAKKHLDAIADVSFTYKPYFVKTSPRGRKSLGGWDITVHKIANAEAEEAKVDYLVHHGAVKRTPKSMRDWMMAEMGFSSSGLDNNDKMLAEYAERLGDDWRLCFESIKANIGRVQKKKDIANVQGYFLKSIGPWITRNKPSSSHNDSVKEYGTADDTEPMVASEPDMTIRPSVNITPPRVKDELNDELLKEFDSLQQEIMKNLIN